MVKVKSKGEANSTENIKLAGTYGAKIHNNQKGSVIAELTSTPDKIKAFE